MSLQTIIDKAQTIEIDRRRMVGQTISRSQRIKTSERSTAQPWKFKITPPGMLRWEDSRSIVELIDFNDRVNEYTIKLSNTAGMNFITEYRGELNSTELSALTIQNASTASITITTLPDIGSTSTSRTYTMTALSFSEANNATYTRALSTSRNDFLITTAEHNQHFNDIKVGDTVSAATYITGGQTITAITRDYFILAGVSYTRIVMSAVANANSDIAFTNNGENISVASSFETYISSSTVVFNVGDFIQPANSRYPYTVTQPVLRGVNTTTSVTLNREIITSEGITISGQTLKTANNCTWQVLVSGLPTYQLVPGKNVQYTGDFELIEKVI